MIFVIVANIVDMCDNIWNCCFNGLFLNKKTMKKRLKILVGCEESQAVTKAFRAKGHEAYSCDILPCSGGHPEWHIQDDVLKYLGKNKYNNFEGWDMMIGFPPCTDLAVSGARWFKEKIANGSQQKSIDFFMELINAPIKKIAIENPIGIMSTHYTKPSQIIQPWQFGHGETKATCLWLKNLPKLKPTDIVEGREQRIWKMAPGADRAKLRSKTFPGIAKALAIQFTAFVDSGYCLSQWENLHILEKNRIFAKYV